MFWIALELTNQIIGLITELSSPVKKLTAFKSAQVAKLYNSGLFQNLTELHVMPVFYPKLAKDNPKLVIFIALHIKPNECKVRFLLFVLFR